jgi:FkbM family methyltransferase
VTVLGHDVEIKETYAAIIQSAERPDVFLDIGANYGTHSLLFLAHQIETVSFEPNESCHSYFKEACLLNQFEPAIQAVALSDRTGCAELRYPEDATWMGSTRPTDTPELEPGHKLITQKVGQCKLDDYRESFGNRRLLVKIDTEGNEYFVLQGALLILRKCLPHVIFESLRNDARAKLFALFEELDYALAALPWSPRGTTRWLSRQKFFDSAGTNFMAVPAHRGSHDAP